MNVRNVIASLLIFSVTQAYAQEFKCESIKEKKVREACITDRKKPEKKRENLQQEFVSQAKSAISRTLKDPASAIFSNLKYIESQERKSQALCGDLNAKNAYGGYTGAKPFISLLAPSADSSGQVWTTWTMQMPNSGDMKNIDREIELVKLAMSYCEDNTLKSIPIVD